MAPCLKFDRFTALKNEKQTEENKIQNKKYEIHTEFI